MCNLWGNERYRGVHIGNRLVTAQMERPSGLTDPSDLQVGGKGRTGVR